MGIAVKYFPAVYIPLLVLRREWRVITGTAAVVVLLWVAGVLFRGGPRLSTFSRAWRLLTFKATSSGSRTMLFCSNHGTVC